MRNGCIRGGGGGGEDKYIGWTNISGQGPSGGRHSIFDVVRDQQVQMMSTHQK